DGAVFHFHVMSFESFFDDINNAEACGRFTTIRAADFNGFAGDDTGLRITCIERKLIEHPSHVLGASADVWRWNVSVVTDEWANFRCKPTSDCFGLTGRELRRIHFHAAFTASERDTH